MRVPWPGYPLRGYARPFFSVGVRLQGRPTAGASDSVGVRYAYTHGYSYGGFQPPVID